MPPAKRSFKSHTRTKPVRKSRRDLSKRRRPKVKSSRSVPAPLSAGASPRVYRFNRGFTSAYTMGTADTANRVYLNTDGKYMVVKLQVEFNRLTSHTEFNSLFSEYKIDSWTTTWTPSFSRNMATVLNVNDSKHLEAIPNFEIISVPARTINASGYEALSAQQIEDYLDQTQRQTIKLSPSGVLHYKTSNPKIVRSMGPIGKAATDDNYTMGKPYWLSTLGTLTPDTSDVSHFGQTLLIRRVDGAAFHTDLTQQMKYRINTRVNFACRKVQ